MASKGRELTSIVPESDDDCYKHVKDKEVLRVLKLIFRKVLQDDYETSIKEVRQFELLW